MLGLGKCMVWIGIRVKIVRVKAIGLGKRL